MNLFAILILLCWVERSSIGNTVKLFSHVFFGKLHMPSIGFEATTSPSILLLWEKKVPVELSLVVLLHWSLLWENGVLYVVVEFGHLIETFRVLLLNLFISLLSCSFLKVMSLNGYAMPWRLLELISLPAVLRSLPLKIKSIKYTQTR